MNAIFENSNVQWLTNKQTTKDTHTYDLDQSLQNLISLLFNIYNKNWILSKNNNNSDKKLGNLLI